jgi:dipeptidyl aminopeptidase/acylaminoacyl peptidase
MEQNVTFQSAGLKLQGVVHLPDGVKAGAKLPCIIVLHGFGSNKNAGNVQIPCKMLNDWGYAAFRFDMRSCGDSEGEFGHILCLDQVEDTRNALTYLQGHPNIDGARIGVMGSSFGAAVALYSGSVDERFTCVISSGGWGNGERKFRGQHPGEAAWKKFTDMLEEGKSYKAQHGKPMMVDRYDIVPVPDRMRHHILEKSVDMFPVDTAQSMYDFKAEEVIHKLAPRPLLLLHSSVDSVTPTEQSIALFNNAGKPKDLHLFNETDHFMFAESMPRVRTVVKEWLDRYFPLKTEGA